jgi:aspartate/methionine/tyrosine aminotransferase
MPSSPRIEYLRWVRAQAACSGPHISLIASGMTPPSPDRLEAPPLSELLDRGVPAEIALTAAIAAELGLSADDVLLQPGTHYSLALLLRARLLERPGPVVVESPAYEPLHRIPAALGADLLRLPRRREKGYRLDLDALAELAAARPSVLVLSHPHNPSGASLSEDEVEALRGFVETTGCGLISDEVYLEFLEGDRSRSLLHRVEGAVILRSFTKVFGLGGLRCTVIAGDREWIDRATDFVDHGPGMVAAPALATARRAWERRQELWARARRVAAGGRAIVVDWLERAGDLLETPIFEGGIVCFPRLHPETHAAALRRAADGENFGYGLDAVAESSHRWIQDLRRRHEVQLVPGAFFETPRAFRLGYGGDESDLREGLDRLENYLRTALEEA